MNDKRTVLIFGHWDTLAQRIDDAFAHLTKDELEMIFVALFGP